MAALIGLFITSALVLERFTAPWWSVAIALGIVWVAIQLIAQAIATRFERQYGSFMLVTLPAMVAVHSKEDLE